MTKHYDISGVSADVEYGVGGVRLQNSAGLFRARDTNDSAFVRVQGADSVVDDDLVTRRQLLASGGSLSGKGGNIYENLQGYIDAADRNSYVGSGTSVTDLMGNATAGTIVASATFDDGAFQFDGASGRISFTKNASLDDLFDGGGTVMCFLRPRSDGEANVGRFLDTSGAGAAGWTALTDNEAADGTMRVRFIQAFSGTNGDWETTDTPLRIDTWNSLAIGYDSSNTVFVPLIYLNTALQGITTNSSPTGAFSTDAGNALNLGNRNADDRAFDGEMAIVLLFDRVLSQTEINQIHNLFQTRSPIGFRGRTSGVSGVNAGQYLIAGGDYLVVSGVRGDGGDVEFRAGNTTSTNTSALGGSMRVTGGNSVNGPGGDIIVKGGDGGTGSDAEFAAGDVPSGGNAGGDATLHGGDQLGTGVGGDVIVRGGRGGTTGSGNGGDTSLVGGQAETLGTAGNVFVRSTGPNAGTTSQSGDIIISTLTGTNLLGVPVTGGVDTLTGDITITTGPPGGDAEQTGDITISTGNTGAGAVTGTGPGTLRLEAGNALGGDINGGTVVIDAGTASGSGDAGNVIINAGRLVSATGVEGSIQKRTDNIANEPHKFRNFEYQSTTTVFELAIRIDGQPLLNTGDGLRLRICVSGKDPVTNADYAGIMQDVIMRRESAALLTTVIVENDRGDSTPAAALWGGLLLVGIVAVGVNNGNVEIRLQGNASTANTVDWWGWVEYMEQ